MITLTSYRHDDSSKTSVRVLKGSLSIVWFRNVPVINTHSRTAVRGAEGFHTLRGYI